MAANFTLCINIDQLSPIGQAIIANLQPADGADCFHLEGKTADGSTLIVLLGQHAKIVERREHDKIVERREHDMPTKIGVGTTVYRAQRKQF